MTGVQTCALPIFTEREALRRFRRTTATWHHKPAFEAVSEFNGTEFTLLIGTDDEIYRYVEEGTRPHEIRPKGNWPLRFQWGGPGSYKAKTSPGNLTSSQGGPSGDWVHFMHVNHPGTEARRFMPEIHREVSEIACETMLDQVQRAIERLLRKR